jgi:hypothetical protein
MLDETKHIQEHDIGFSNGHVGLGGTGLGKDGPYNSQKTFNIDCPIWNYQCFILHEPLPY